MDQTGQTPPPEPPEVPPPPQMPPPPPTPPSPRPMPRPHGYRPTPPPPQPPVVQVVSRPPGFGRLFGAFVTGLSVVAGVFLTGIVAGVLLVGIISLWAAGRGIQEYVLWEMYRDGGANTVAIVPVEGTIDGARAEFIRLCVEDLLAESSVKAVVLRVNSGGGGVTASDQIWYQVGRLQQKGLPVVASFGSVAASGGYYVSCASDYIMAEETCITGSIGVIAQIMTFQGLLDKVGVEPVTLVASGSPRKNIANDIFRSWNEEDRQQVMTMLDASYDLFRQRVRDGRSAVAEKLEGLDELADGSIFTARQALAGSLIDGIGYLDDAIGQAEQLAGIPTGGATVMMLRERPELFPGLPFVQARRGVRGDVLDPEAIRSFVNELGTVRLMYLMH